MATLPSRLASGSTARSRSAFSCAVRLGGTLGEDQRGGAGDVRRRHRGALHVRGLRDAVGRVGRRGSAPRCRRCRPAARPRRPGSSPRHAVAEVDGGRPSRSEMFGRSCGGSAAPVANAIVSLAGRGVSCDGVRDGGHEARSRRAWTKMPEPRAVVDPVSPAPRSRSGRRGCTASALSTQVSEPGWSTVAVVLLAERRAGVLERRSRAPRFVKPAAAAAQPAAGTANGSVSNLSGRQRREGREGSSVIMPGRGEVDARRGRSWRTRASSSSRPVAPTQRMLADGYSHGQLALPGRWSRFWPSVARGDHEQTSPGAPGSCPARSAVGSRSASDTLTTRGAVAGGVVERVGDVGAASRWSARRARARS